MNSYCQFVVGAARIAMLVSLAAFPSMLCAQGASARPLITGVSHLSVYTIDAEKTEHFYVHDLGSVKRGDPPMSALAIWHSSRSQLTTKAFCMSRSRMSILFPY